MENLLAYPAIIVLRAHPLLILHLRCLVYRAPLPLLSISLHSYPECSLRSRLTDVHPPNLSLRHQSFRTTTHIFVASPLHNMFSRVLPPPRLRLPLQFLYRARVNNVYVLNLVVLHFFSLNPGNNHFSSFLSFLHFPEFRHLCLFFAYFSSNRLLFWSFSLYEDLSSRLYSPFGPFRVQRNCFSSPFSSFFLSFDNHFHIILSKKLIFFAF